LNGTLYYIRAYATNSQGTVYGNRVNYTTKNIPVLTTNASTVSAALPGVVSSGGVITDDGGTVIITRGVCWSATNATPDITDSHTIDGAGAGLFYSTLAGLDASKKYYVRAYATNGAGTGYGNVIIPTVATVNTLVGNVVSATDNSVATSGGTVTDEGGAAVTERGVCWSSVSSPVTTDAHTSDGSRSGSFTSTLTGLKNATTYYVRAYASNAMGTVYGAQSNFLTKTIPTLITTVPAVSTAEPGVVTSGGNITDDGGAAVTVRGVCWSATHIIPDITDSITKNGPGEGLFTSTLRGLDAGNN